MRGILTLVETVRTEAELRRIRREKRAEAKMRRAVKNKMRRDVANKAIDPEDDEGCGC